EPLRLDAGGGARSGSATPAVRRGRVSSSVQSRPDAQPRRVALFPDDLLAARTNIGAPSTGKPERELGLAGLAGQAVGADADLGERIGPLGVEVLAEQQLLVGVAGQPDALPQLALELTWAPAGVAQRQQRTARAALGVAQGVQHLA